MVLLKMRSFSSETHLYKQSLDGLTLEEKHELRAPPTRKLSLIWMSLNIVLTHTIWNSLAYLQTRNCFPLPLCLFLIFFFSRISNQIGVIGVNCPLLAPFVQTL